MHSGPGQEGNANGLVGVRRRGWIIAAVGLALILTASVLRQLVAPRMPLPVGAQFLEVPSVSGFARPAMMFASVVTEFLVLSAVSRAMERRRFNVAKIALTTACLAIAVMLGFGLATWAAHGAHRARLGGVLFGSPLGGLEIFGLWVLAFRYPQLVDDARLRSLEIERARQAAEISRLREHLQPHFLRNSLNAIAALVVEDPSEARNLLGALGDLLGDSIESTTASRPLREELAWLRRYAEILEVRYRGALSFAWDEGPMTQGAMVPRLLLQPLLENAVHHGALGRDGGGRVTVRTRVRDGGGTRIEIEDDGPGFDPSAAPQDGLGLRLVRGRVELEGRGSFRIEQSPQGTRAIVELP
jgi:anti-sigma regulatory factor (Ser/Thr protein kinase)